MKGPKRNRGMALLVVLVVVALLTALITELAFSTLVDLRLTETFRDTTRAYYLAKGGINAGRMILREDRNNYDALDEVWSRGVVSYPVGDGSVSVQISDLDGKLGLNSLVSGNTPQSVVVDRLYRLLVALDISALADPAELTAALIDWMDSGDEPYATILTDGANIPVAGAESSYYQGLARPYQARNGPLETVEELLQVKGFTTEILRLLEPHVSVQNHSAININTASSQVLMALSQEVDAGVAEAILARRSDAPLIAISELEGVLSIGPYSALKALGNANLLTTTSERYRIEAEAVVGDGRRRLLAEVNKRDNRLLFFKVN